MPNQKLTQTDAEIKTTTIILPAEGLLMAIAERGLTVDRIARIGVDTEGGKALLTFTNAPITVEGKRHFTLPRIEFPIFVTWFKAKGMFIFEIEGAKGSDKLFDIVARQLEGIKNRNEGLVNTIYFVGNGDALDRRQFIMAGGKTTCFTRQFDTRVAGIRYNYRTNHLYALLFKKSLGVMLLIRDLESLKTPHDLEIPMEWDQVGPTIEPGILSLSRPMVVGNDTVFMANLPDDMLCEFKICGRNRPVLVWGKPQKGYVAILGHLFGQTDIYIGYKFEDEEIKVIFEKSYEVLPFVV